MGSHQARERISRDFIVINIDVLCIQQTRFVFCVEKNGSGLTKYDWSNTRTFIKLPFIVLKKIWPKTV